ncbi:hypothetical protein FF011L_50870 [Roseimaritima multifibrata]|uniref:Alpha/beta hydrolase family protein n=1 Tax=Roseimaritima multifibrata TaxID=1930274 RepID=A0A517MN17_9BACT|nr:alpha/beta hydrolase [Roseimaritima multifibrata]QDS96279.1 hypothetical protein FF011L_50870 [Roseimaritima multifibrata]
MRYPRCLLSTLLLTAFSAVIAVAEYNVPLANGLMVRGSVVEIASLNENAFSKGSGTQPTARPIWMIDDGLRRVFVHQQGMVAVKGDGVVPEVPDLQIRLEIPQNVSSSGRFLGSIGAVHGVSDFSDLGRRKIMIPGPSGGSIPIWQGMTEVTARYIKLQSLHASHNYIWEMRIATSSVPQAQLRRILHNRMQPLTYEIRLDLIRLFIEAEMFEAARQELLTTIAEFPDKPNLKKQLTSLVDRQAKQLLLEAQQRRRAGQYELSARMLSEFQTDQIAAVTKLEFSDELVDLQKELQKGPDLVAQLETQIANLPNEQGAAFQGLLTELKEDISPDTISRLSDYIRLGNDEKIPLENRVALAVGGWILGSGSGLQNLALGRSLIQVRDGVAAYLRSEDPGQRQAILDALRKLEGATVENIAKILPLIRPQRPLPEHPEDWVASPETPPGMYRISIPGPDELATEYIVQLPEEYNPLRAYPAVVSLCAPTGIPRAQIEWWSGSYNESLKMRLGQASRQGYVVIAPLWTRPGQRVYEYTEREHHRVMTCLRDAMRRVSIDADRVFLSGHGDGGTAAWDIGIAHPDVWAGVIPISADPSKYIIHYEDNATDLPIYMVFGEMAGSQAPLVRFGYILDDYMTSKHKAMVVMMRGRGPEDFYEEIHHIFDWMALGANRRGPPPKEIDVVTMRGEDRFFWWLEMPQIDPRNDLNPFLWDYVKKRLKGIVRASVAENNTIRITQGPADQFVIWMNPDMGINLNEQVTIRYLSRLTRFDFDGDIKTILEDVRTRADRQRPYWAFVTAP